MPRAGIDLAIYGIIDKCLDLSPTEVHCFCSESGSHRDFTILYIKFIYEDSEDSDYENDIFSSGLKIDNYFLLQVKITQEINYS